MISAEFQKHLLRICATGLLCLGISATGINAQSTSSTDPRPGNPALSDEGWHVDIVPYIWFAGVHGIAGVLGHDASIHADFSEVLDDLNLGAMATVQAAYNRIVIPIDFMWIKLTCPATPTELQAATFLWQLVFGESEF